MNMKIEDAGPCRKTLRIEVPAERVQGEYKTILDAYVKSARIPGFRQGRAPQHLVQKRFTKEIEQDVKDSLIPEAYRAAIEEGKLNPVAILGVHDVSFSPDKAMTFGITLDVPPEFALPDYRGLEVQGKKTEVSDADVDGTIKRILEDHAHWSDVLDRGVQTGDLVQIDYEGGCGGKPVEQVAPKAVGLGKGKDFWMLADENAFLPGFDTGLAGAKPGEKRQVQVDFKADFAEPALAGKACTYFVDVKAIRKKDLPALDADMLKKLGVESEDKLRLRIREDLQKFGEDMEKRRQKGEIIRLLLEKTKLDVPESVVQQETRETIYDMVRQHSVRGASRDQIEEKKDEIFEVASRSAGEKVKIRYILHKIAEEEKIEISEDDLKARMEAMAAQYNARPEDVRSELERREALDDIREDIRINKALDVVLANAKIKV